MKEGLGLSITGAKEDAPATNFFYFPSFARTLVVDTRPRGPSIVRYKWQSVDKPARNGIDSYDTKLDLTGALFAILDYKYRIDGPFTILDYKLFTFQFCYQRRHPEGRPARKDNEPAISALRASRGYCQRHYHCFDCVWFHTGVWAVDNMDCDEADMGGIQEHRSESASKRIYPDDMGRDNRVPRFRYHMLPTSQRSNTAMVLTLWALQVQFLLQIIINRCRIIAHDKEFMDKLKIGVAVLITAVNISVYNIWIPARLEISQSYIHINEWWDRVEKVIYMLTDAFLNIYFIRTVQHGLVRNGLTKYRGLVHFNMMIVGFSLSMDLLIITMMSLPNTFVYMQFHPLAYIVKLNIELSMADLIGRIARNRDHNEFIQYDPTSNDSRKLSRPRSRVMSTTGTIIDKWHNTGFSGWNRRSDATAVEFNDITRPDTVYAVNATNNNDIESGLDQSRGIYTTREFCVDFKQMAASQSHPSEAGSNLASTSSRGNEDTNILRSDQTAYVVTDDGPRQNGRLDA
ncbi:hypothetical protein CHU98_g7681 [Xylaria longipes]|nr:hypothetical protein CHU98_g7681 [Xylaria longipes]